jgi:hypothetical protein
VGFLAKTGKAAGVNPEAWKIINNKLFLSWDKEGAEKFQKNADELIGEANKKWMELINR